MQFSIKNGIFAKHHLGSMNMRNRFLISGLLYLVLFAGCKKDFSVNADYEDFPIVLGLLSLTSDTHYIKIYKSFVTENNAYDAAKDIHKYSYMDSVQVFVVERNTKGDSLRRINFDTTTEIPKDAGIFAYPTQIAYKAIANLNADYKYQLFVYNPYTKKMAYSQPLLLAGTVTVTKPMFSLFGITENAFSIEYKPAKNAYRYEFVITFYYSEEMKDRTLKSGKPIIWNLGQQVPQASSTGIDKFSIASGLFFFQNIANNIVDRDEVISRRTDSIILSIYTAGEDWDKYLLANKPSSGINQNRLDYTNIFAYNTETKEEKYALGIFSSRSTTTKWFRDLATPATRDSLFHGRFTKNLKFTDMY